jgi:DNA-binding transcriptional MerR regulator
MDEPVFSSGQAAAAAGLSRKALRLYEQRGLLVAPERTAAGYRRYARADIDILIFIRCARGLGLRVDDIATILARRRDGRPPCDTTRAVLDQRIGEIDATLADLAALRAALALVRDRANQVRPDDDDADLPTGSGYVCPLIEQAGQ